MCTYNMDSLHVVVILIDNSCCRQIKSLKVLCKSSFLDCFFFCQIKNNKKINSYVRTLLGGSRQDIFAGLVMQNEISNKTTLFTSEL